MTWLQVWIAQSCPTCCDPVDGSPPGSSVHGILQAGILEWVASFFSRGSSWPTGRTQVSRIAGGFFTIRATREAPPWLRLQLLAVATGFKPRSTCCKRSCSFHLQRNGPDPQTADCPLTPWFPPSQPSGYCQQEPTPGWEERKPMSGYLVFLLLLLTL